MLPLAIAGLSFAVNSGMAQESWPQTKAEKTAYLETSSYQDVVDFLDSLLTHNPPMRLEWIGKSEKGKDIPLVIVAKDPQITPAKAKSQGKLVVYLQANIHAGEVEGKESVLMLLREIAQKKSHPYLDKMVLLVTPIYNIDGNDNWGPLMRNRPSQDGPDPIGQRANGQGFDLNRDCMKAESHEMRAVLEHVYNKWDPEAMMDLHTTNGTRHGYVLTYSPPLNPSTDEGILNYSRDYLLPKIRADFKKNGGQELFDYGNTERRDNAMRWATFEEYPRYVTNYNGIRNRIPILSEAASFQPFSLRVDATLRFVKMVLDNLSSDSKKVIDLCRNADKRMVEFSKSGKEVGIRFAMDQRGNEKVILEKPDPQDPVEHNKAPKHFQEVEMPVYDRFKVVKTAKFPTAYLFPASFQNVADLLVRQGAKVERLKEDWQAGGDFFEIKEAEAAGQAFQGHKLIRLEGEFHRSKAKFDKGSFVVRSGQPLGLLIFHMLEPESLDGAIAWGFFGEGFKVGDSAPMTKVFQHVDGKTGVFPGKD